MATITTVQESLSRLEASNAVLLALVAKQKTALDALAAAHGATSAELDSVQSRVDAVTSAIDTAVASIPA